MQEQLIMRDDLTLALRAPRINRRDFFRRSAAAAAGGILLASGRLAEAVTTDNIAYGTRVAMTVTNLQSLANDATDPYAGWQSDRVDNRSTLADDYIIHVKLPMANTAPANDKAVYVYLIPWMHDGSSTWNPAGNFSTTTAPTGTEGTASITEPNSMKGPIALPYPTQQQQVDGWFNVATLCGGLVPDGWSIAIRNTTGAAFSTGCVVEYRPITYTNG